MKKKYLQVFQQYKNSPPGHHGQEGLVHLWDLCIHIDTNTEFQFDGYVVIPDGDLFDPASHQQFVKFGEAGSLLCDVILQVIDPLYLFVSCGSVDSGLLAELSESENLISNFVIGFFALGFLNKLLLQGHQLLVDVFNGGLL